MVSTRSPLLRKRLWLAGGGIGLFLLTLVVAGPLLDRDRDDGKLNLGYDFLPAYVAGRFARTGDFAGMYDRVAFSEMQSRVIGEADLEMGGRFGSALNPPHFSLMFAPLSALPYRTAAAVWLAMNVVFLAASVVLLVRMLPPEARQAENWRTWGLVPLLVITSMPCCQAAGHQQNTFLSLLLISAMVTLWRGGRGFAAGAAAGLLLYKPQLALVVAMVLAVDMGRRAVFGMGLTAGLTLLLTVTAMPGALEEYVRTVPGNVEWIQNQPTYNWGRQATLLGFWRLLLASPVLARGMWIAGAIAVGAALAAAIIRSRRDPGIARDRLIAAAIASTPLLVPYYLDYDLLLLAVPAVLFAVDVARQDRWMRSDRWTLRAWVGLYLWAYLNPGLSGILRVNLTVPLLTAVAAGLIARCLRRTGGIETEERPAEVAATAMQPAARAA